MILRKYVSLVGIGSATIDLTLPKTTYKAGEHIQGYFLIKGGIIDQKAKRIDCDLIMVEQSTGKEKIVDTSTIFTSRLIQQEEICKISFTFEIPSSILHSTKDISYRFETKLTFSEGVTSKDQDMIHIIS